MCGSCKTKTCSGVNMDEANDYTVFGILGSQSGGYEQYYLLGYNAGYSVVSLPVFRKNISPPSSGSNDKSKIPARKHVTSFLPPVSPSEISVYFSTDYTALYPRRYYSSMSYFSGVADCISEPFHTTRSRHDRYQHGGRTISEKRTNDC
jgi:hypothetical protein